MTVRTHHWNAAEKALATDLLDGQLTPIVRRLLLLDDLRRSIRQQLSTGGNNGSHIAGMEIEHFKQVKQLLILLRRSLDSISSNVGNNGNTATQSGQFDGAHIKLMNQLNGIALPLLNILRPEQDSKAVEYVRRSCNYAIVEEAALSLVVLWKIVRKTDESDDCIKTLALPILVSCAMALPGLDICQDVETVAKDDGQKKSDSADSALDKGEDCAMAILQLIQITFANDPSSIEDGNCKNEFIFSTLNGLDHGKISFTATLSKEVGEAIGGSLVARLVLSCLSLLAQESIISSNNSAFVRKPTEKSATLQLESLKTMFAFLEGISNQGLWRSVLPGCFASLYRSILTNMRYKSAASSHKVASASIVVLSFLLKRSLAVPPPIVCCGKESTQSTMSALMKVLDQAKNASSEQTTEEAPGSLPQSNEQTTTFKHEVNSRMVGPLSVLLSMIPSNGSLLVRKSGIELCRVLLIDSWHIWTVKNSESLGRKAFEYCLSLLSDDDDAELQLYSREIITSYKSHIGIESWRLRLSKSIVPVILEMIELLPTFAKSGRDVEVCNHLRLIDGYLLISFWNMGNEFDMKQCLASKSKSEIGPALGCPEAIHLMRKSFGVLFAPDNNIITVKPVIENGLSSEPNKLVRCVDHRSFKFLHLLDETVEMAKRTVRLLACTLGGKRSAFVIDECIAKAFRSYLECASRDIDPNQQLELCGSLVFANEILAGMSARANDCVSNGSNGEQRILNSLASAVLPVIISHPLWTLPTTLPEGDIDSTPSTVNMRSNSLLVCQLMRLIGRFATSLGRDMRLNMATILLPLLERASAIGNHSTVQICAFETISDVAVASGYSDLFELFADNFFHISDHVTLQLRRHSKERTPASRSLLGVIDVILRCAVREDRVDQSHVPLVSNILTCVLNHFDRLNDRSRLASLDTVCVLQSINKFMETSIDARTEFQCKSLPFEAMQCYDWKKRSYLGMENGSGIHDDDDGKFTSDDEDGLNDVEEEPHPTNTNAENDAVVEFANEIATINGVAKRCSYLLCHQDLRMQVLCIDTLLSGFRSLGKVGAYPCRSKQGESASNPLLPSIAEHWPSVLARLKETSSKLRSKKMLSLAELSIRHMMAADQEKSPSDASLIVLLSKLLEIVTELCVISDGFFAGRFQNDVYPILAKIMGDTIPSEMDHARTNSSLRPSLSTNRRSALNTVLTCLKVVYRSSCKEALAGLIPSCGTILLPLLAHEGDIGEDVVDVLKAMLAVDSDVLCSQLNNLSGNKNPRQPLDPVHSGSHRQENCTTVTTNSLLKFSMASSAIMAKRASLLLEFIEQLRADQ